MRWRSPNACELCNRKLTGAAEINSIIVKGLSVLIVKQSLTVNWSFCGLCRNVACRESCFDVKSGYCKPCANDAAEPENFNQRVAVAPDSGDDILSAEIVF